MISEPADAAVRSLKQMNSIPEGALLAGSASAGSQPLLDCSLLLSKAHLQSLGTAAEIFALTTLKVSMVLWEKDILGQFCSCVKLGVDCCSAHVQSLVWQSGIWFLQAGRVWSDPGVGNSEGLSHLCSRGFLRRVG